MISFNALWELLSAINAQQVLGVTPGFGRLTFLEQVDEHAAIGLVFEWAAGLEVLKRGQALAKFFLWHMGSPYTKEILSTRLLLEVQVFHHNRKEEDYLPGKILHYKRRPDMGRLEKIEENKTGRNTKFRDKKTGEVKTRAKVADEIRKGHYPDYHLRKVNGVDTPCSNPNSSEKDNLG
jgi:hypothetical protein